MGRTEFTCDDNVVQEGCAVCISTRRDYTAVIMNNSVWIHNHDGRGRSDKTNDTRCPWALCLIPAAYFWLSFACGCDDPMRQVGQRARPVVVQTVVDQGVTLDKDADAKKVVYVLLRAIKDDVEAGNDFSAREAAFDRQLAVCAPDFIFNSSSRQSLGREEGVRRIVWHWAPTLGHYTGDFPVDLARAGERLIVAPSTAKQIAKAEDGVGVLLELADPSGDPNASVIAKFLLVREAGYQRIAHVGFYKGKRHLPKELGVGAPDAG